MKQQVLTSLDLVQLTAVGKCMGQHLQTGTIVVLSGDLGTGKTQISSAVARGLGIRDAITSPTFAIMKQYLRGRVPFNHLDLYRLETPYELDDLNFWDLVERDHSSVTLIEWGEIFDAVLRVSDLQIKLEVESESLRKLTAIALSPRGEALLASCFGPDDDGASDESAALASAELTTEEA
ncbi:MAG: tRNA (adenosine(37)-N6)-threonylcarbamoyltransferase complex ATPase subunit type 1 TsaE [Coriobacteriia bacterium]|nr:tRNA (adenosine(37)-N6)-threonylcarbamoyltransferase complex ATPase subunit type 1 TsaE [Coriobacteriia bacterium]MCL2536738.1 tRNA (adenosine(37)-N6)-threonylcarbamoyltransferase complex ATPase subunit type 1 TsaE [Coriobacteriia bacterium]